MQKIRVMVVDDSALIRQVLSAIINAQPDMEVVGTASNPFMARDRLRALAPDVMTLDVEMPLMNGLDFLERLMAVHPMPVLMVSTLTESGSQMTLRALELGAVDFISKPKLGIAQALQDYAGEICSKLRAAASARVRVRAGVRAEAKPTRPAASGRVASKRLVIVGASTGGPEALKDFLLRMPIDCPGILIAQHMPANFTRSFADRLNNQTGLSVCEATQGQVIQPGHVFIAPGHSHLLVQRVGGRYVTSLSQADPVNRHRPSVDVLFHSAAQVLGADAIGVILTGMGRDGAVGMLAMHDAGATTFAQDEESCIVFGMPREAIALGGVDKTLPLDQIAAHVMRAATTDH